MSMEQKRILGIPEKFSAKDGKGNEGHGWTRRDAQKCLESAQRKQKHKKK